VPVPAGPLPSSILLWHADELRDPPRAPCCLSSTRAGSRAAVYRTGPGGGVAALVDFTADAAERPHGGWAAEAVVHVLASPLPRPALLDDDVLAPVFRHLRGRRRLPEPAARRLTGLLGLGACLPPSGPGTHGVLCPRQEEVAMGGFMENAKEFADQHDEQVDQGLEKAGDLADERTGGEHRDQIDRGVDTAQERTGQGDTQP
jgi:hypothetical protein